MPEIIANEHLRHEHLDLRTTEDLADAEAATVDAFREFRTGCPARPGTLR